MGLPEGLAAREFAVCVVEGVRFEMAVAAAMWDTTRVLLIVERWLGTNSGEVGSVVLWLTLGVSEPLRETTGRVAEAVRKLHALLQEGWC